MARSASCVAAVSLISRLRIVAMIASVLPRILSNTEMSLFYNNVSEYCFSFTIVFELARSASCVAAYLMLKHDWDALRALKHIRQFRQIEASYAI
jgi:hypothetical protein